MTIFWSCDVLIVSDKKDRTVRQRVEKKKINRFYTPYNPSNVKLDIEYVAGMTTPELSHHPSRHPGRQHPHI
jgi:hypothetical protein